MWMYICTDLWCYRSVVLKLFSCKTPFVYGASLIILNLEFLLNKYIYSLIQFCNINGGGALMHKIYFIKIPQNLLRTTAYIYRNWIVWRSDQTKTLQWILNMNLKQVVWHYSYDKVATVQRVHLIVSICFWCIISDQHQSFVTPF